MFDLIELSEDYKERELENKMLEKLKNVLLELGNGFSFVGNQYKITIDNMDFYIDLLFYHVKLKCYIAVELSTEEEINLHLLIEENDTIYNKFKQPTKTNFDVDNKK